LKETRDELDDSSRRGAQHEAILSRHVGAGFRRHGFGSADRLAVAAIRGWMRTLGDLFIRLIAMFVGLIIFCAVVHGIATVREAKKVGRIAIKAPIYFEVVTTFALVIGLAMVNLLGPGRGMHVDLQSIAGSAVDPYLKTAQQISGSGFLLSIVPHTAISAFTEGNVQVVFLSVLFEERPRRQALFRVRQRRTTISAVRNKRTGSHLC
jgi:Na+/H+-dicarboxylate symporter